MRKLTLLSGVKMSKKKTLLLLLAIICVAIILAYTMNLNSASPNTPENQSGNHSETSEQETPEGPMFVVPENPLGTLGLISAFVVAFGVFALKKKARQKQTL